jgi:D-apionolactonase
MLPTNVIYYGKAEPLPEQIALRAGILSLVYENGDLRYIRLGRHEVVRRIYVAVRDHNWDTVLPALSNVQIAAGADTFRITYDADHHQGDLRFTWRATIAGDANSTIRFAMDGQAQTTFLRNRIGFCLLHPDTCAGAAARIEHVDGMVEASQFPRYIAPQAVIDGAIHPAYPFAEMRAVSHEVAQGVWAEVRLAGEIFEMEDQRNWIDGSYKTYGTPLRLAFPVEVTAGTRVDQVVILSLQDDRRSTTDERRTTNDKRRTTTFIVEQPSVVGGRSSVVGRLPRIGLGAASHGQPLSERELERLRALNLSHLRVDLRLADSAYVAALRRVVGEAVALGIRLEVALFLSDDAEIELDELLAVLRELRPPIATWLIFHSAEKSTSERWIALARARLATYDAAIPVGSGTNVYFTELNRQRPPAAALDLVCYSMNPQVHAFDNASLAETCATIAATLESARQLARGRPIAVTPITLRPRFNPNATGPEPEPRPGQLPSQVDARQMSLFGAGWTLGSLKYLAEGGAASATFFETSGWRGVMETTTGSPLPEVFRAPPGGVFPLYHVLADAGEFAEAEVIRSTSSDPLKVDGFVLRKDDGMRVLLANLSAVPQLVTVQGLGVRAQVRVLDETNAEAAMREPETFRAQADEEQNTADGTLELMLRPYAIVRIDSNLEMRD